MLSGPAARRRTLPHSWHCLQVQGWARLVSFRPLMPHLVFAQQHPSYLSSLFSSSFYRRRFDLQNPSRTERNVEMFGAVERALIQVTYTHISTHSLNPNKDTQQMALSLFLCVQNNCMSQPVVYLDPALDQELASRLTAIITKHQVTCCTEHWLWADRRLHTGRRQCLEVYWDMLAD